MSDKTKPKQRDEKGRLLPGHNLGVRFGDGQPTDLGGRRRTFVGMLLTDYGYTKTEIKEAVRILAFNSLDELDELRKDTTKPALVTLIANQFWAAYEESNYEKVRAILELYVGRPHQTKDVNVKKTVTERRPVIIVKSTDEEE